MWCGVSRDHGPSWGGGGQNWGSQGQQLGLGEGVSAGERKGRRLGCTVRGRGEGWARGRLIYSPQSYIWRS